jgi:hypothetical protein
MSPAAVRWAAVPIGLLAFALHLATKFWAFPYSRRFDFGDRMLIMLGATLVAVVIPFGIYLMICRPARRRPDRFVARDGGFVVEPSPAFAGSQVILWMFLSGGMVVFERVPGGDSMRLAQHDFTWPALLIGVGIFWTGAAAFLLVQRPRLRLDSDGLTIHRLWAVTRLTWDELAPGSPSTTISRRQRHLTVHRARQPQFGRGPTGADIPIYRLHIDPAFLAGAIRHYAEHPGRRAAIGTAQESSRLRQAAGHPWTSLKPI